MRDAIPISDPGDARIAAYRDIRERDLVGRKGLFIAEGRIVLHALLEGGRFDVDSILVLENRLAGLAGEIALKPPEVPVYVAPRPVIDAIAGFPLHRGILAIGRRSEEADIAELVPPAGMTCLIVVCAGISNHDNVGSIFRNAAAFGADAVLLDKTSCDPLYRKALRVSAGAALKVSFARGGSIGQIIDQLKAQTVEAISLSPSGAEPIDDIEPRSRTAIILGSEGDGLPAAVMAATRTARIAMAPGFDSLNVAAASAIALHRFRLKMR